MEAKLKDLARRIEAEVATAEQAAQLATCILYYTPHADVFQVTVAREILRAPRTADLPWIEFAARELAESVLRFEKRSGDGDWRPGSY